MEVGRTVVCGQHYHAERSQLSFNLPVLVESEA